MKPTRIALKRRFMERVRDSLSLIGSDEAHSAAGAIRHALDYRPDLAVASNRVAFDRELLHSVSVLLWGRVDDPSLPDAVRDEAYSLAWAIGDIVCYRQDLVVHGIGRLPTGFETANYYTDFVNQLVYDLYGSEEPNDFRRITIMLARTCATCCDDMLYTREFAYENYEVLVELVDSIRRHANDDDDDEIADDEEHLVRSDNGFDD